MERQTKMELDQQRLAESLTAAQKKLNDEKSILVLSIKVYIKLIVDM